MNRFLSRLGRDERGATAIEYGLIAAVLFLAIVGAVTLFSSRATDMFDHVSETIGDAVNGEG